MRSADLELVAMRIMACAVSHSTSESKRDAVAILRRFERAAKLEVLRELQARDPSYSHTWRATVAAMIEELEKGHTDATDK